MKEVFEEIKVSKINNRFHARLILNDGSNRVIDEMACSKKEDIGYICSTMLRWADKLGWPSQMASASRDRQSKKYTTPQGKIWYQGDLKRERNETT